MSGPKYLQIASDLRDQITQGKLQSGTALPTERRLMEHYSVSRVTIRRALRDLVDAALLNSKQGSAYMVSPALVLPLSRITSFSEDCIARGLTPGSTLLSKREGKINPTENLHFEVHDNTRVVRVKRIRTGDDEPLSVEHATLLADIGIEWPWPDNSLYKAMEKQNCMPVKVRQRYEPVLASDSLAKKLNLHPGAPLMLVVRAGFCALNKPVEYSHCWFRPDRWEFSNELNR